jgi:very-short-patch-repair endonuclease
MTDREARERLQLLAADQHGVVSRRQAAELGVDRWAIAHEVAAGRWAAVGEVTVALHRGALAPMALARGAVWEASDTAVLDGTTSLALAGMTGFVDGVHVLCRWPNGGVSWRGSIIHNSRLWNPDDFVTTQGIRRTRNAVAAVRAAMYARSDRAAATVMAMAVQQRLARAGEVLLEARRVNRHKRRPLILAVAGDIADGAQSLGELDFARLCRRRRLPPPTRQAVRRGRDGRVYLDATWDEFGLVVEIEGAHHDAPHHVVDDCLRQNDLSLEGGTRVLRIPVLGLRTTPAPFLDQVERALVAGGWRRAA